MYLDRYENGVGGEQLIREFGLWWIKKEEINELGYDTWPRGV